MDELVTTALVGTAQRVGTDMASGTPIDELIAQSELREVERKLLLQAGASAVYRVAGALPRRDIAALASASPEVQPPCSPAAAELIRGFLSGTHPELLPEALERLRSARRRLPFDLLPLALSTKVNHPALAHVLGARGRWLSSFNPAWAWVRGTDIENAGTLLADAETIWQEGTSSERIATLRQVRAANPARAREWLAAAWKREKAEMRAELLEVLRNGISLADEPFLETALDDRAGSVRERAAVLLALLPGSALSRRMAERADSILSYGGDQLKVKDPPSADASALRDGLPAPTAGQGGREQPIADILGRVPLTHWNERFGAGSDVLAAAAGSVKATWRWSILDGWTNAFLLHGGGAWVQPLWQAWLELPGASAGNKKYRRQEACGQLVPRLPAAELERVAREQIANRGADFPLALSEILSALPRPWSVDLGTMYLSGLRQFISMLTPKSTDFAPWDDTLEAAALGLPAGCYSVALEPITLPESTAWYLREFARKLDSFAETIHLRSRMIEEISL